MDLGGNHILKGSCVLGWKNMGWFPRRSDKYMAGCGARQTIFSQTLHTFDSRTNISSDNI